MTYICMTIDIHEKKVNNTKKRITEKCKRKQS